MVNIAAAIEITYNNNYNYNYNWPFFLNHCYQILSRALNLDILLYTPYIICINKSVRIIIYLFKGLTRVKFDTKRLILYGTYQIMMVTGRNLPLNNETNTGNKFINKFM